MDYVIGSGPAGIACADGLLARGRKVTIIDAGLTLEPEREAMRAAMAPRDKDEWTEDERKALETPLAVDGMPKFKLVQGSDYPYRAAPGAPPLRIEAAGIAASYAQGGLSNVWGAALLPYRARELADWPVSESELAPAYRAVLDFLPLAGIIDDLAEDWPLYTDRPGDMPLSRQAARLLARLTRHRQALLARKLRFGRARLGVDAAGTPNRLPCIACGECLNGCPRDLIFSTRHELDRLRGAGLVNYIAGVVVRRVEESDTSVRLQGVNAAGDQLVFSGARAFVAAGVIGTAGLMLRSLGISRAEIMDSQYFLFPLLQWRAIPGVAAERLHTLAQIFLELDDPEVSPHNVHLQLYGYSSLLKAALVRKLGGLAGVFPTEALLARMMVVQGYLHSSHSGTLEARLDHDVLTVTPRRRPETAKALRRLLRRMTRLAWLMGALPLAPLLQETVPGRGFHSGGSFPMRAAPGPGETDRLGRPFGRKRTHIVDSSVFSDVPAAAITLTVMANAWRIGHESAVEGRT